MESETPKYIVFFDKQVSENIKQQSIEVLKELNEFMDDNNVVIYNDNTDIPKQYKNIGIIGGATFYREMNIDPFMPEPLTLTRKFPTLDTTMLLANPSDPNIVVQKEPIKSDKVGRNNLCPCNSGKKAKKCCHK